MAKLIHEFFNPEPVNNNQYSWSSFAKISSSMSDDERTIIEKYNARISTLANKEIANAQWKNIVIASGMSSATTSQAVPISSLGLPFEVKRRIDRERLVERQEEHTSRRIIRKINEKRDKSNSEETTTAPTFEKVSSLPSSICLIS